MGRRHHKLGSRRIDDKLVNDVNLRAIPVLQPHYRVHDASSYSILGDAPKVLLVHQTSRGLEHAYIAKAPRREGPRECVTEHIISYIGRGLPVRLAKWRLARIRPRPGVVPGSDDPGSRNFCPDDVRFMSRFFLRPDETLVHGVELVAQCFDMEPPQIQEEITNRQDERQFYTVSLIDNVLREIACDTANYRSLLDGFARMMAFDALIGANDRHPQNWGVIVNIRERAKPPRFSPLFDTARGLFWNHTDERLREHEQQRGGRRSFIEKYARRSTPLVGIEGTRDPNHFVLIDHLMRHPSKAFAVAIRNLLSEFAPQHVDRILHHAAGHCVSRLRLEFMAELLRFRYAELASICKL